VSRKISLRIIANLVSVIFHPIFILYYIFLSLYLVSPVEYIFSEQKQEVALHLLVAGMSIFFPLVSTLALRASGLISSLNLKNHQERIGPMIASMVFYVWLYLNYRQFDVGPSIFEAVILGAIISISTSFFINNFSKISLHAVGAGGLLGAIGIFRFTIPIKYYQLPIGDHILQFSPNLFLAMVVVIVGMIGTSRLLLGAHRPEDVYGGYLVGIISQIVAYRLWDFI